MQNNIAKSGLLQSYLAQSGIKPDVNSVSDGLQAKNTNLNAFPLNNSLEQDSYQSQNPQDKEKGKKNTIAKVALAAAAGISLTVGVVAAFRHKGGVLGTAKETFSKVKNAFNSSSEKASKTLENAKNAGVSDFRKGADNINNAKDSVVRHFLMKIPGYEKFDSWASNIYKKASLNTLGKHYSKAKDAVSVADDTVLGLLDKSGLSETEIKRTKELISKRQESLTSFTSKDAIKDRMSKLDDHMQRLDREAWEKFKSVKGEKPKSIFRKFSREALAEDKLTEAKGIQKGLISPFRNMGLNEDEANELSGLIKKATKNSDDSVKKIISKADKKFNKAYSKEDMDLFEKLRDINHGSAPGDILGTLGTVGLLGIYTAQADSKEEKVGVTLTTGIPLMVSLGTTIGMTIKMIGGAKALLVGATSGLVANAIGNKINKKYQEAKGIDKPVKTIVTLDDYIKNPVNNIPQEIKT